MIYSVLHLKNFLSVLIKSSCTPTFLDLLLGTLRHVIFVDASGSCLESSMSGGSVGNFRMKYLE
jgi:hypothetical protein